MSQTQTLRLHGLVQRAKTNASVVMSGTLLIAIVLVAIAAPVPLLHLNGARQAAAGASELAATVLDLALPRRVKPAFGRVSYAELTQGSFRLRDRPVRCAPAHSPRLAEEIAQQLLEALQAGRFPLRLPSRALGSRSAQLPLDP